MRQSGFQGAAPDGLKFVLFFLQHLTTILSDHKNKLIHVKKNLMTRQRLSLWCLVCYHQWKIQVNIFVQIQGSHFVHILLKITQKIYEIYDIVLLFHCSYCMCVTLCVRVCMGVSSIHRHDLMVSYYLLFHCIFRGEWAGNVQGVPSPVHHIATNEGPRPDDD